MNEMLLKITLASFKGKIKFYMSFSTGIKGAFDFSAFTASAGAFALSLIKEKYMELDNLISTREN